MTEDGRLYLDGDDVAFVCERRSWRLPLRHIRVIGELTNQNGPGADYWFCFATDSNDWHEASFYAEGRDQFLRDIESRLGPCGKLQLYASTDFASFVLWPPALVGRPMFQFNANWPRNPIGRVLVKFTGGPWSNTQTFAPEVESYLRAQQTH